MAEEIDDQLFKRIVLYNQYQILALLDQQNREGWERAARIAQSHWPLDELPGVDVFRSYEKDPFTKADRRELLDALDLHEVLQDAEDTGIRASSRDGWDASFPGFSGNEEGAHLSYYRDLVKEGERWPSLRRTNPRDLNSHFPVLDMYRRMVEAWHAMGRPRRLSQEQFDTIVDARVHPENRVPVE